MHYNTFSILLLGDYLVKPVMVWGATGFIGRHLLQSLIARDIAVLAITRRPAELQPRHPLVQWMSVSADDSTIETFAEALRRVDTVFNLAGTSGAVGSNLDPLGSLDGNCYVQAHFLRACELAQSRPHVVLASSRLVYGTPNQIPVSEDCSTRPASYYAVHKLAVEQYHHIASRRSVISYTICRISNPYGAEGFAQSGHWCGFIDGLIDRGCRGDPMEIYGDGNQLRDYIFIDDLTDALCRCATIEGARNETFNIGRGEGLCVWDAAQIIHDHTGTAAVRLPWHPEAMLVESGDFVGDISKAQRLLGFRPQFDFEETVKLLIEKRTSVSRRAPRKTANL